MVKLNAFLAVKKKILKIQQEFILLKYSTSKCVKHNSYSSCLLQNAADYYITKWVNYILSSYDKMSNNNKLCLPLMLFVRQKLSL